MSPAFVYPTQAFKCIFTFTHSNCNATLLYQTDENNIVFWVNSQPEYGKTKLLFQIIARWLNILISDFIIIAKKKLLSALLPMPILPPPQFFQMNMFSCMSQTSNLFWGELIYDIDLNHRFQSKSVDLYKWETSKHDTGYGCKQPYSHTNDIYRIVKSASCKSIEICVDLT